MKCIKLTYKSPMFGSVSCEELIDDPKGYVEFGPEGMYALACRGCFVEQFLEKEQEDLADYVPEDLEGFVVKAIFGKYEEADCKMFLITEIFVKEEPDHAQLSSIDAWITGQMSDGWGEGVEQREVLEDRVRFNKPYFDESSGDFESCEEYCYANYFIRPWRANGFYLEIAHKEEVELEIPCDPPVVHSAKAQLQESGEYIVRTVYQFIDPDALVPFMRNSGAWISEELIQWYENTGGLGCAVRYYLIHETCGIHSKFLPILGTLDMDVHRARIYSIDAEDGSVNMEEYTEEYYKDFYNDFLNK